MWILFCVGVALIFAPLIFSEPVQDWKQKLDDLDAELEKRKLKVEAAMKDLDKREALLEAKIQAYKTKCQGN
jgi:hypothetical protein